jgi:hypothetical protein
VSLSALLDAWEAGEAPTALMVARWREAAAGAGLPPRFLAVLEQVLQAAESADLAGGESCSFSRTDLVENLRTWLTHARERAPSLGD